MDQMRLRGEPFLRQIRPGLMSPKGTVKGSEKGLENGHGRVKENRRGAGLE